MGGAPEGFMLAEASVVSDGALVLGDSLDTRMTTQARTDAAARFGVDAADLDAPTVLDAAWRMFGELADPTGINRSKPIMPGRDGVRKLRLGGLVKQEKFTWGVGPEFPNIRAVIRNDFAQLKAADIAHGSDHYKQVAGGLERQYGKPISEILGYPEESRLPRTVVTDNFNRTNQNGLGSSSEGWSWGDDGINSIDIVNNQAKNTSVGDQEARADVDLSSINHFAQMTIVDYVARSAGVCVRYENALDGDRYLLRGNPAGDASNKWQIFSYVGSFSLIANTGGSPIDGDVLKGDIDGSDLELFRDASSVLTQTSVTITTSVRAGLRLAGNDGIGVDWSADDGITGGGIRNPFGGPMVLRNPLGA